MFYVLYQQGKEHDMRATLIDKDSSTVMEERRAHAKPSTTARRPDSSTITRSDQPFVPPCTGTSSPNAIQF